MDRILTNGLFLKDETEKKNSRKWTLSAKGRSNQTKIFQGSYLCAQCSYIVPLVSFYFSKMPVIYLNLQ